MTDLASAEAELSNYTGALSLYKKTLSIDPKHIGAFVGITHCDVLLPSLSARSLTSYRKCFENVIQVSCV